jgi:hypothetical protein
MEERQKMQLRHLEPIPFVKLTYPSDLTAVA